MIHEVPIITGGIHDRKYSSKVLVNDMIYLDRVIVLSDLASWESDHRHFMIIDREQDQVHPDGCEIAAQ